MYPGGVFGFIVTIVAIIAFGKVLVESMRHRRQSAAEEAESANAELVERLEALEERVRVLERIVTDDSSALRDRISGL